MSNQLYKNQQMQLLELPTTICGTDLGIFKGKNPEVASGRILSHEGIRSVYNFVFFLINLFSDPIEFIG
ncbi:hypothetical protein [Mesomycoplasma hyopneumoniae]|uniref:hypothetical protein n=1 Tax=Mesomycoplasma hyopneumoniae TaxID=2099 RepID=UPI0032677CE7